MQEVHSSRCKDNRDNSYKDRLDNNDQNITLDIK